jgi:hypothetical protein
VANSTMKWPSLSARLRAIALRLVALRLFSDIPLRFPCLAAASSGAARVEAFVSSVAQPASEPAQTSAYSITVLSAT